MITTFDWEVLTSNERGFALLERLAVDGGWLYRTTERCAAFSDYRTIFAQQVTFVPAPSESTKSHFETVGKLAAALPDKNAVDYVVAMSDDAKQYAVDNKWVRDADDDLRDSYGKRMIWYKPLVVDDWDVDSWRAKGIDDDFPTEDAAILAHKTKFGDL